MPDIRHSRIAPGPGRPEIAYSQAGDGPDVVLVHGALVTRADMVMALFETLSDRFRVTAFDRPGHGDSEPRVPGSPWEQAAALHGAAEVLGLDRPVLVGHSIGGAVAISYAMQFPERTCGVAALSPICLPELRLEHLLFGPRAAPVSGRIAAETLSRTLDPLLLPALWRAMFLPQSVPARYAAALPFEQVAHPGGTEAVGQDALWLNTGLIRTFVAAPACRTRVAILGAERDLVVNNRLHGALLARLLPKGSYEELDGLGHMLHHFAQPRIREAVEQLLAA